MAEELKEKVINLEDLKQAYNLLRDLFESGADLKVNAGNIPGCTEWFGTKDEYEALANYDPNTLYNVDDGSTQQAVMRIRGTCLQADLPVAHQSEGDTYLLNDTTGPYVGQMAIWIVTDGIGSWGYTSASIQIDSEVTPTGTNPVEGKGIYNVLVNKVDKEVGKGLFSGFYNDLKDKPDCLLRSGGTMEGIIYRNGYLAQGTGNTGGVYMSGGNGGYMSGASFELYGKENSTHHGKFALVASDGTTAPALVGSADGKLTWNGNDLITKGTLQSFYNGIFPVGTVTFGFSAPGVPAGISAAWTDVSSSYNGRWLKIDYYNNAGTYENESISIANHALTVNEIPSHAHTRGTMNITGSILDISGRRDFGREVRGTGCFNSVSHTWNWEFGGGGGQANTSTLSFNAASNWSGETSYTGSNWGHNHSASSIKPYTITIKAWKRTA